MSPAPPPPPLGSIITSPCPPGGNVPLIFKGLGA